MMKISVDAKDKETLLRLQGKITVDHASELRDAMLKALGSGDSVTLELSGVTEADISFMQLVCSAHKSARDAGKRLSLIGGRESIWQAFETAGFLHHRGCAASLEPCVMASSALKEAP